MKSIKRNLGLLSYAPKSKKIVKKKNVHQRGGKDKLRKGVTHASIISPPLHLYIQDVGSPLPSHVAMVPCPKVFLTPQQQFSHTPPY